MYQFTKFKLVQHCKDLNSWFTVIQRVTKMLHQLHFTDQEKYWTAGSHNLSLW